MDIKRVYDRKAQVVTADGDDRSHGLLDRLDLFRTRRSKGGNVGYGDDLWWFRQVTRRGKQKYESYESCGPLKADLAPRCRGNLKYSERFTVRSVHLLPFSDGARSVPEYIRQDP